MSGCKLCDEDNDKGICSTETAVPIQNVKDNTINRFQYKQTAISKSYNEKTTQLVAKSKQFNPDILKQQIMLHKTLHNTMCHKKIIQLK